MEDDPKPKIPLESRIRVLPIGPDNDSNAFGDWTFLVRVDLRQGELNGSASPHVWMLFGNSEGKTAYENGAFQFAKAITDEEATQYMQTFAYQQMKETPTL